MIYICTWHRAATFCRHHEILTSLFIFCKARGKKELQDPIFVVNSDFQNHPFKSRTEQLFTMAQSTSCRTTFLHLTTHYAFSSSAFAQLRLTFFTRRCVEPSPKHIYTAEILNIPPRASKWKFEPCDRASILDYICVLRFVSGNLCQQFSVTTKRCNCFRGNRSWENAGLLLGSL